MRSRHSTSTALPSDGGTKQRVRRGFLVSLSALVAGVGLFATQVTTQADDNGWDDDGWYGGSYNPDYDPYDNPYSPYFYDDDDWDDDWDD